MRRSGRDRAARPLGSGWKSSRRRGNSGSTCPQYPTRFTPWSGSEACGRLSSGARDYFHNQSNSLTLWYPPLYSTQGAFIDSRFVYRRIVVFGRRCTIASGGASRGKVAPRGDEGGLPLPAHDRGPLAVPARLTPLSRRSQGARTIQVHSPDGSNARPACRPRRIPRPRSRSQTITPVEVRVTGRLRCRPDDPTRQVQRSSVRRRSGLQTRFSEE